MFVHRIMDRYVRPRLGVPAHYGHEDAHRGAEHLLLEAIGLGGSEHGESRSSPARDASSSASSAAGGDDVQRQLAADASASYFNGGTTAGVPSSLSPSVSGSGPTWGGG